MHVVGGEEGLAVRQRQRIEPLDPRNVVAGVKVAGGEMAERGKLAGEMGEDGGEYTVLP